MQEYPCQDLQQIYIPNYLTKKIFNKQMNSQIEILSFIQDTFKKGRCGCYIRNPYAIGIKFQRALVPLRHIDYHLEIVNSLLNITLKQKYYNPTDKYLEVDYSLPIQPESSIYKFQAEFDNKKIEGIVKEKEEAKKEYEKAKSQGKQAVLGTIDADSKDILNLEIGNIPPKTQFTVTISMLQEIQISLNTFYRLQVPSTISPRYMNKAQNGVVKVPQHMKNEGQGSGKPDFDWSFKIDLKTTRKVIFFDSPSHNITLLNQNQNGTETLLVMEKSQIPNKDFVFLYTTQNFHLPSYVVGSTDISSTVMLSFIPKFCGLEINDAYKAAVANKLYETDMSAAKGDYVFFLDRSGSMGGTRIQKAKEALILFLKSLPEDSFFNVISFGSGSKKMFNQSQRNNAEKVNKSVKEIQKMTADMGGTEIYAPLQSLLRQKVQQGYPRQVFLLTDGGVSNTEGVLEMVRKNTKYCRVHTIGIGNGASLNLIEGCAKNGKGKHILISDDENPSEKIIELLESALTPIISKVNLKCLNGDNDIESIVPNPKSIPYILKDDIVNFYITFKGPFADKKQFSFEYQDSVTKLPYKTEIEVQASTLDNNQPFVDKMAHLKVLKSLQTSAKDGIEVEDQMFYVKVKDFKKQAIEYSVKHQVLSQYTAFICISKELVDGQFQQFQSKGVEKVHVEQPQPIEYKNVSPTLSYMTAPQAVSYNSLLRCADMRFASPAAGRGENLQSLALKSQCLEKQSCISIKSSAKKKSAGIGSVFGAITETVSSLFSTSKAQKKEAPKLSSYAQKQMQFDDDEDKSNDVGQQFMANVAYESLSIPSQSAKLQDIKCKNQNQNQKKKKKQQKLVIYDVNSIVKAQDPNGSWNDLSFIDKLAKNPKEVHEKVKEWGIELVVTQLILVWMQKHYNEKQYALIIKKALAWIKKASTQKGITNEQLKLIECL